jgi:hypothetical protein
MAALFLATAAGTAAALFGKAAGYVGCLFWQKPPGYGGCSVWNTFVTSLETIKTLAAGLSFAGAQ